MNYGPDCLTEVFSVHPWSNKYQQTATYNLKLQSLGWLCMPKVATESPSDMDISRQKVTLSSHRLGPIEDLAWTPSPKLDV